MKTLQTDVLVVGAGPAGLASALELRRQGVERVTVVDREAKVGGIPRLCHHTGFGIWDLHRLYSGPQYARRYAQLAREAGVDIRTATTVTGWEDSHAVAVTSPQGIGVVTARAILLATGVRERPRAARLVPGDRPRGVFTTGSLQRFVDEHRLPVGRRAVIVGAELVSLSAFMTLTAAGVQVAAFITHLPCHQIAFPYTLAKWWLVDLVHRTPIHTRVHIHRILGRRRVEGVEVIHRKTGRQAIIPCDTVVFTGDWIPEHEVARRGGVAIDPGTLGPQVDGQFRTSVPGVFAAGNLLRGVETAATSAMEGRLAAAHIGAYLQGTPWPAHRLPIQVQAPIAWIFPNSIPVEGPPRPPRQMRFRVSQLCSQAVVQVRQGGRTLYTQAFRRLVPNETVYLRAGWLAQVDGHGEPPQLILQE